jgi:hypothetical protein
VFLHLIIAFILAAQEKETPIRPEAGVVKLFNGKDKTGLYAWLKGSGLKGSKGVFTVHDGMIHASGEDLGYLATDKEYHDYHLIVDYKWGKKTYESKTVRNSGILLHAVGPDGGAGRVWMSCIECQLAQGCVGDLIVIRGKDQDGSVVPSRSGFQRSHRHSREGRCRKPLGRMESG